MENWWNNKNILLPLTSQASLLLLRKSPNEKIKEDAAETSALIMNHSS